MDERLVASSHAPQGDPQEVISALRFAFDRIFGGEPHVIIRSPGRMNLIGEHSDYNDGFVLPLAIDREICFAARPRVDGLVVAYSANYNRAARFSLHDLISDRLEPWSNYLWAVASTLHKERLPLIGMDAVITGSLPAGAGLSSSAALELATAYAFRALGHFDLPSSQIALLCQRAENELVGVQCGIMDQFVVALARAGHALFLDCRDLTYRHVPLPKNLSIVVTDSGIRRQLASSAYNERRAECAAGVSILRTQLPGIRALRDVTPDQLTRHGHLLSSLLRRRCAHVVGEIERVRAAVQALERGDNSTVGLLLDDAHRSLRDNYEVSLPEIDLLVAIARQAGSLGSRLTGAGFGGCVISLVPDAHTSNFISEVTRAYQAKSGRLTESYPCKARNGAEILVEHV